MWRIQPSDLDQAERVVRASLAVTPLVELPLWPKTWAKLEFEQPTGSFKVRGALAKLCALTQEQADRGIIAASAGNHGLGVAYAARALRLHATVCVPSSSPRIKSEGIARLGATVTLVDGGYDDAQDHALALAAQTGASFVSPYDDALVAAGNGGTLVRELIATIKPARIVLPVGGGGLLVGACEALLDAGVSCEVVAVQSEACPAMVVSLREGAARERYDSAPTLAEGLEGGVAKDAFENVQRLSRAGLCRIELVGEEAIAAAMREAKARCGWTIEGSAAVAWAWMQAHGLIPCPGPTVLVLTGKNVD